MEKKKFLPARLVKGDYRWYIIFYQTDPASGTLLPFRRTYSINRIKDKRRRIKVGNMHVNEINRLLPLGWPFVVEEPVQNYTLLEAIQLALQAKYNTTERNTHRSYKSISKVFLEYCEKKRLAKKDVLEFTKKNAYAFLDYALVKRKLGGKTYNNYLIHLKALWNVMIERELADQNPWVGIKKATVLEKNRRCFNEEERRIVAKYIEERDIHMFWAILLQYYCFLRPVELRRLKFKNFDLVKGTIHVSPSINKKSKKHRLLTIPPYPLRIFRQPEFTKNPTNYFVFGEFLLPHPDKQCSHNTMNKRHKRYLRELKKNGELPTIEGLKFYSWKDTGITDHSEIVSLINLQRQAGHSKPETTLIYYQPDEINHEIKKIDRDIFS